MLKFFEKIWKTIAFQIRICKAWKQIAPPEETEEMLNLNDLIQLKCIKSIYAKVENCKDDEKEYDEDAEFESGISVYSLNEKLDKTLTNQGHTVYRGPMEIYRAQKFVIL